MKITYAVLWMLSALLLLGAGFGAVAKAARERVGWNAAVLTWVVGALAVAGAVTARVADLEQRVGSPTYCHMLLFCDFAAFALLTFALPAFMGARRGAQIPLQSTGAAAAAGAAWAIPGAILALLLALLLDIAGVPFAGR